MDRTVKLVFKSRETLEGAGVRLRRAFGDPTIAHLFDPFLLLDDFGSRYPHEYLAGFPWHPHRGFETVTYLLKGEVYHEDSTGNKGVIKTGDVQWMTAGSGIFHSEMPRPMKILRAGRTIEDPEMRGFQLWVNLPSSHKMTIPKYRNLASENIPEAELDDGTKVRIIAGEINRIPHQGKLVGLIRDIAVDTHYLDITMPPESEFTYRVKPGYTVFTYVIEGRGIFDIRSNKVAEQRHTVLYGREGDLIRVKTNLTSVRFLLIAGKPINEPIAWYGPIVMNTQDQLVKAFQELKQGTFVKHKATSYDYVKD